MSTFRPVFAARLLRKVKLTNAQSTRRVLCSLEVSL